MTIIYALLMLVMLGFAGLQYNDDDGLYWAIIYLVPAIALGFAAFAPHRFSTLIGRILLFLAVIILASGVYVYWPSEANFWNNANWWDAEPVREGLGVAIAYLFTCATIPLAFRRSSRRAKMLKDKQPKKQKEKKQKEKKSKKQKQENNFDEDESKYKL